jgi:methylglyoxal synthase
MNQSTADFLFSSAYIDKKYERKILDYSSRLMTTGDKKNE